MLGRVPEAETYAALLRKRGRGSPRELRWLLRMAKEYPLEGLSAVLCEVLAVLKAAIHSAIPALCAATTTSSLPAKNSVCVRSPA
jgi:hypothetical protein